MNTFEILKLSGLITSAKNLEALYKIEQEIGSYDHPQIYRDLGTSYFILGNKNLVKEKLIQGAKYGLKFPCEVYNSNFVDSIGQCFMLLLTQYPVCNSNSTYKATMLAYLFLSRCIEMYPREAQDSYRSRGLLYEDQHLPYTTQLVIKENSNFGAMSEPLIISDYYFAAKATGSPHQNCLSWADRVHKSLGDISIGGKDADDYLLQEIALLGEHRHFKLYKKIEEQFIANTLNLTTNELQSILN